MRIDYLRYRISTSKRSIHYKRLLCELSPNIALNVSTSRMCAGPGFDGAHYVRPEELRDHRHVGADDVHHVVPMGVRRFSRRLDVLGLTLARPLLPQPG